MRTRGSVRLVGSRDFFDSEGEIIRGRIFNFNGTGSPMTSSSTGSSRPRTHKKARAISDIIVPGATLDPDVTITSPLGSAIRLNGQIPVRKGLGMLTLYFFPGACSMAAHIVLEESGEKYELEKVDLAKGEQGSETYLKINPQGRVPVLRLDNGEPLTENTAILPYLGRRFGLWPTEAVAEARALSLIGFFATTVHPAHAHFNRPERYANDPSAFPALQETGLKVFHECLKQIDGMLAAREWFSDRYTVLDPYGLVFYSWGLRRGLPMRELENYTAFKERMLKRPAVRRVVEEEAIQL